MRVILLSPASFKIYSLLMGICSKNFWLEVMI